MGVDRGNVRCADVQMFITRSPLSCAMRSRSCGVSGKPARKCRGLGHRPVRMIGGEHHPVHTDLRQDLEKCWDPVESAERVIDVVTQVVRRARSNGVPVAGSTRSSLGDMNGGTSPMWPMIAINHPQQVSRGFDVPRPGADG